MAKDPKYHWTGTKWVLNRPHFENQIAVLQEAIDKRKAYIPDYKHEDDLKIKMLQQDIDRIRKILAEGP